MGANTGTGALSYCESDERDCRFVPRQTHLPTPANVSQISAFPVTGMGLQEGRPA